MTKSENSQAFQRRIQKELTMYTASNIVAYRSKYGSITAESVSMRRCSYKRVGDNKSIGNEQECVWRISNIEDIEHKKTINFFTIPLIGLAIPTFSLFIFFFTYGMRDFGSSWIGVVLDWILLLCLLCSINFFYVAVRVFSDVFVWHNIKLRYRDEDNGEHDDILWHFYGEDPSDAMVALCDAMIISRHIKKYDVLCKSNVDREQLCNEKEYLDALVGKYVEICEEPVP